MFLYTAAISGSPDLFSLTLLGQKEFSISFFKDVSCRCDQFFLHTNTADIDYSHMVTVTL